MITRGVVIKVAIIVAAAGFALLIVFGLIDVHDAAVLKEKHAQLARDASDARATALATDTAGRRVDSAAKIAQGSDSAVRVVIRRLPGRVDTILKSAVPETVKVRELVHEIETLRDTALANANACTTLRNDCMEFRARVRRDSIATSREIADYGAALKVAERRARKWGLGCAIGYGVARVPSSGQVVLAPSVSCGVAWRW